MLKQDQLQVAFPADPFQQLFQIRFRVDKMRGRDVDGIMVKDGFQVRLAVILFRKTYVTVDQIVFIFSDTVVIISVPVFETEFCHDVDVNIINFLNILPQPVNLIVGFLTLPV